jgi:hypothetical protein
MSPLKKAQHEVKKRQRAVDEAAAAIESLAKWRDILQSRAEDLRHAQLRLLELEDNG